MNDLRHIEHAYFLGIGGIGMSALARYFNHIGLKVAGYDRTKTDLTAALQNEGINVHYEDNISLIPKNCNPHNTLAVYTPAIPDDHKELTWFREHSFNLLKRARVLGTISNGKSGIAVSGTHGKTTVSTMVANFLNKTEKGCGAFVGGISKNFNSNLLLPKQDSPWIVVEADEFDRSFLNLNPQLALITSIDEDHLDIYGSKKEIIKSFEQFISQIKPGGKLVVKAGVQLNTSISSASLLSYSLKGETDFATRNLRLNEKAGCYEFDLQTPDTLIKDCRVNYPGLVNVENAVGAAALALLAGAGEAQIREGFADYKGVARRFDIRYRDEHTIYIDDYAHHPEELRAVISSVKALYPNRRITGLFQPHLYSRTKDFAKEFAASLDLLDTAVLIPLYPARELPIPGVSSLIIYEKMKLANKYLVDKKEALDILRRETTDIVLTMGAGDIDRLTTGIVEILKAKK